MNSKYLIAGIGSIIFSFNTLILFILEYIRILIPVIHTLRDMNIYIIFNIIISVGILLMGAVYLELYLKNREILSLFVLIIGLSASSFLLISNSLQAYNHSNRIPFVYPIFAIPYYETYLIVHELWGIYLALITIFFILIGIHLIIKRNYMKNKNLTLYTGILALILSPISLIFSCRYLFARMEELSFLINYLKVDQISEIYGYPFGLNIIFHGWLFPDSAVPYKQYMITSSLILGFLTFLISIIFFLESKNAELGIENQTRPTTHTSGSKALGNCCLCLGIFCFILTSGFSYTSSPLVAIFPAAGLFFIFIAAICFAADGKEDKRRTPTEEVGIILFQADKFGKYSTEFKNFASMNNSKIIITVNDLIIEPEKGDQIKIDIKKIREIIGYVRKDTPYYKLILENNKIIYISFFNWRYISIEELDIKFKYILEKNFGMKIVEGEMGDIKK
ncbi:MAG: hypothetical protein HWN67_02435 [Candidatus Helarchaeota archaeon]|nr:hypothetical protein [Candidatus Helarchaeota archaeon]